MSVAALTWAFQQPLAGNEKVILLSLADWSNDQGYCFPSYGSIAEKAYIHRSTCIRLIKNLVDMGYIKLGDHPKGDKASNAYYLALGGVAICDQSQNETSRTVATGGSHTCDQGGRTVATDNEPSSISSVNHHTQGVGEKDVSLNEEEIKRRIRNATGWQSPDLDYTPILKLLKSGANLEAHVLPVMERFADKAYTRSLKFFVSGIEAAMAKELNCTKDEATSLDWELYVSNFVKFADAAKARGLSSAPDFAWAKSWGPRPSEAGCQAPIEILKQYGFSA